VSRLPRTEPGQAADAGQLAKPTGTLTAEHLSMTFAGNRQVHALADVSVTAAPGEVVSLVGPSGCGKTTLLNLLAGFEVPTAGQISVDGRQVSGPGPDRGVLFQNYGLFPWLTVEKNMAFGRQYASRGRDSRAARDQVRQRVDYYLNRLGLTPARDRYPYQISGGMQARTALGRTLVADAGILLLDEPFSAVDALTRSSLHKLLLELLAAGESRTVLLITHDIDEAIVLSDRVLVMSPAPGRIIGEVTVPFGRGRVYEDIVQDTRVVETRREVMSLLHFL
jgi:ABC-type nitrate/sulfonate/bicarbonate transport system ATPase subunit